VGGRAANAAASECADRPPTPDPSPPRADARGGRGEEDPSLRALAKQSISPSKERVDCFVAFAPLRKRCAFVAGNDDRYNSAFSRRISPELCYQLSALASEGAGNAGRMVRPAAACARVES
jgi:hypothetical protein